MRQNFLQFMQEKQAEVVYQSDAGYEQFLKDIKFLPETVKNRLIKEYLEQKKNGMNPQIDTMIEK